MHILITDITGQVGHELPHCAWPNDMKSIAASYNALYLTDTVSIEPCIVRSGFDAIINTSVDKAETDSTTAWKINNLAPVITSAASKRLDSLFLTVSTDYVFDGSAPDGQAITTADYPIPARRPANLVLDVAAIGRDYAVHPRLWTEALSEPLAELWTETSKTPEDN